MNTNPNTTTTTIRLSAETIASVVEALLTEADYSVPMMHHSDRIDTTITILNTLGYTFSSAVCAPGFIDQNGRGIHGHTNGNYYTMVSPHHDLIPVVYLARDTGRVSI